MNDFSSQHIDRIVREQAVAEAKAAAEGSLMEPVINEAALEVARKAVEDVLVEFRDERISILNRGNGFVIREPNGQESSIMRLSTSDGLRIGLKAYLQAVTDL